MKNKILKHSIHLTLILSALLAFISCENSFEQSNSEENLNSSERKTYLSVQVKTSNKGRTVNPTYVTGPEDFSSFKLMGYFEGETEPSLVISETSYANFQAETTAREITAGNWIFDMEALDSTDAITYKGRVPATIKQGESNSVTFNLKPAGDAGISITMTLEDNTGIDKVIATLRNLNDEPVDSKEFDISTKTGADRNITYSKTPVTPDTYKILFEFFAGANQETTHQGNDPTPINQWESYVKVVEGVTTSDTINLNFNSVYTITYKNSDGQIIDFGSLAEDDTNYSGIAISKYSARSNFDLPVCTPPEGQVFAGWTTTTGTDLSSANTITKITYKIAEDLTLQPYFTTPVLYVSGSGDDSKHGFNASYPLESVNKACEQIVKYGNENLAWTIKIVGDVTGPHTSNRKEGLRTSANDYGRSIIPETLTTDYAKSITLTGNNPLDANDMPQDKINRGLDGHDRDGSEEGVNLVVATSVPVTINNLLLINGNNAYPNGSSKPYVFTGGGLLVTSNATVTLGDGVVIKENRAKLGGGVYNAGTLFIHGTALIGDRTVSSVSTGYGSGQCSNSTSGDGGAGIYNSGKLYLGYSDENTPAEWDTEKGGIYYNYAYWNSAGALYNSLSGEVFFKSGIIKYNCGQFAGGAVYNLGTFKMEGGTIENNHSGSTGGGGVYNASSNSGGSGTFIMSGGSINSNTTASNGGGIFSEGTVYIYGSAVIGNADAENTASSDTACSNYAESNGGGMYLTGNGKCYIGYSSFTSAKVNTIASWGGGIYYNYATNGGGIWVHSSDSLKTGLYINSGKIEKNGVTSSGLGGAIYLGGNNFSLGGSAEIPPETGNKQDIYILSNASSIVLNESISTTVKPYISLRYYSESQKLLVRDTSLTSDDLSITTEASKFTIPDQENTDLEAPIEWEIKEVEDGNGYLKPKKPQATPSNNNITIDIGYNTVDLDMRPDGTYSAYSQSGSVYTLKDTSKAFKIYLYNSGNYQDYKWILEGEQISTADNIIFGGPSGEDIASWAKGNYDLTFECTRKEDNLKYSYSVQIKIQ